MRASGPLANTPPQQVEFFGIARRLVDFIPRFEAPKPRIMSARGIADKR